MSETLLPNIIQFLSQIDPFDKLPVDIVRTLGHQILITYLPKGESVQPVIQGDKYLYVIRTGSDEQGLKDGVLRARLGPEDLFGFTFLEQKPEDEESYVATAIENTLLYLISLSALLNLFQQQNFFWRR